MLEKKRLLVRDEAAATGSQKNGWLKFETSGELPIIFEESIDLPLKYAPV